MPQGCAESQDVDLNHISTLEVTCAHTLHTSISHPRTPTWVSDRGRVCHRHTHAGRVTHTHAERDTAHCRPDVRLPVSEPSSATSTVRPCLTRVLGVGASGRLGSLVRSSRTQVLSISLSTILGVSLMPHACRMAAAPLDITPTFQHEKGGTIA